MFPLIIQLESMSCGDLLASGGAIIEVCKTLNRQSQPVSIGYARAESLRTGTHFRWPALAHRRPRLRNEANYRPFRVPTATTGPVIPNEPSPISGHLDAAGPAPADATTAKLLIGADPNIGSPSRNPVPINRRLA